MIGLGSMPGKAMESALQDMWLLGSTPPQDYWVHPLPPPDVGLSGGTALNIESRATIGASFHGIIGMISP